MLVTTTKNCYEEGMFWPSVLSLKQFYHTALGRMVGRMLYDRVQARWGEIGDDHLLGIGYCTPILRWMRRHEPNSTMLSVMPASQGAAYWPNNADNCVLLCEETHLPLADQQVNRVLVLHAVENTESLRVMLEEIWRVLLPGGRAMLIVPNRRGVWARSQRSPFAHGRPFTPSQISDLVENATNLTVLDCDSALYFWPGRSAWYLKIAEWIERIGHAVFPNVGGVLLVEVQKQIYAAVKEPTRKKALSLSPLRAKPALGRAKNQT